MDDIEERLVKHNNSFESLLGLIPSNLYYADPNRDSQWKRKKQTPEEKMQARRAKLDPELSIESALDKRRRIEKENSNHKEQQAENEKSQQTHLQKLEQNKQKKRKNADQDVNTERGQIKLDNSERDISKKNEVRNKSSENPKADVFKSVGTDKPAEAKQQEQSDRKPLGTDLIALHDRLQKKIAEMKQKRKAPGTVLKNNVVQTREAILENRRKKRELRLAKKKLKNKKDAEDEPIDDSEGNSSEGDESASEEEEHTEGKNVAFNRILLGENEVYDSEKKVKLAHRKKKGPVDVKGALASIEAKKERMAKYDEEKQRQIQESDAWHNSLLRANGEKIRENEKQVRKAVKRIDAQKRKSEQEWKEREQKIEQRKAFKQRKREENLARRRQEKENKGKKSSKTIRDKKRRRAGFEGSFKAKH